ncbi:MAG: glucosamine-6-phosphate deaminase [Candidatus Nanoarchaeia archaeon]
MNIIITKNKKEAVEKTAEIISELINKKPNAILQLATGLTMVPLYSELVKLYKKGKIDFSKVSTFNLDEYAGLNFNDKESYHYYMNKYLFDKVNIQKCNTHFPSSNKKDYEDEMNKKGGVDLTILGIGVNGHIAFNEPGSSFNSTTREVKLSETTLEANSKLFPTIKKVPREAYTVGLKTIMKSKKIVLLAFGSKKSEAITKSLKGPITRKVPASVLREHKNATFIIDKNASKGL